jgi:hypothetical protein
MKRYVIRLTSNHTEAAQASNSTAAKYKIWNRIKDSYTYGYRTKLQFMRGTTVVK